MSATLARLQDLFRDIFEDDEIVITPETTAADIENWDSLMHVTIIVSVESAFKVRFTSSEVGRLRNVGDLVTLIETHQAS